MSWFNNDIRVATTATPSFQQEVNVGGFGWTGADQGHYNQLIQYVDECRLIYKEIESKVEIFERVEDEAENIERAINFISETAKEVREINTSVESTFQQNSLMVNEIKTMADNIKAMHNDFLPKYQDFLEKYEEIMNKFP